MLGNIKLKCHWHDFDCDYGDRSCTSCPHMPRDEDKPNYNKPRKKADLDGWGMPVCPSCYEPTYDEKRCLFCGQAIKLRVYPPKPLIVRWKGYRGVSVSGSFWVHHNGRLILHAQCKKMTPEEARNQLKSMPKLLKALEEIEKGENNDSRKPRNT